MGTEHITRRRVLRNAVAGVAATGFAGTALTHSTGRTIVGLTADAGFDVARQHADTVTHELDFGAIGKAVTGRFPEQALRALAANPKVRYVEDDGLMSALQSYSWSLDQIDADIAHAQSETGDGSSIAILDTGVDDGHPDIDVVGGAAFGSSCSTCADPYGDDSGHGTPCAGIAAANNTGDIAVSVAPDADLYSVKVLDSSGSGSYSDIADGIVWVANQGIHIASLSLGGSSGSSVLQDAVEYADNMGVLIVAAAGNSGSCTDCVGYPAAYDEVVAVSATDSNDDLATFSSTGPEIEIAAPGVDIPTTSKGGGYETLSGTSMATPHVAGGAALLMANGYTNDEARQLLTDNADDICLCEEDQGAGRLNVAAPFGFTTPQSCDSTISCQNDGDGGCFITTATAGEGETLESLRRFRDESMAATPLGRGLVGVYYRISPPIAETLARHPDSRSVTACRKIVESCASLADAQEETDSRVKRASLGVVLTALYLAVVAVGAGSHAGITVRELAD